jgi:hypothetical protein
VLTSLSRGGDANNLARASLEDEEIADTYVVAGNGDGVGSTATLNVAHAFPARSSGNRPTLLTFNDNLLAPARVVLVALLVMVTTTVDGVHDAVGGTFEAAADRVVVASVVVVSHFGCFRFFDFDCSFGFDVDSFSGSTAFVFVVYFDVVSLTEAGTVITFGDVDFCLAVRSLTFDFDVYVGVAGSSFAVDFDVNVCVTDWLTFFSVAISGELDFGESGLFLDMNTLFVTAVFSGAVFSEAWVLFFVDFRGRVAIFPSDVFLGIDLYFDFGLGSLLGVVAVRRREEAQGNGDSGVKVQIAG